MNDGTEPIGERIRAASERVSAPLGLREHVSRAQAAKRRPQRPSRLALAFLGLMLATIATVGALLAPEPPTVAQVAAAALHAPEDAAPDGDSYLPGFRAIGTRTDTVDGRRAETVIYRRGTVGVHYTVVEGRPLDLPAGDRARAGDRELALARDGGVSLVVWHQEGKTCILASRATTPEAMAELLRSRS